MKYIISATNRKNSNSLKVAHVVQNIYQKIDDEIEIISLKDMPFHELAKNPYADQLPKKIEEAISKLNRSTGLVVICPEYNGSFPGIFKFFIDHWDYPKTFAYRPFCFVGLGGRFGGLRPVEQLQQIMENLHAFVYPKKVFLQNINSLLKEDEIQDKNILRLLNEQAKGFSNFVRALEEGSLLPHKM